MPATDATPLDPGRSEARRLLEHELTKPRYHSDSLLDRAIRWLLEQLSSLYHHSIGGLPPLWLVVLVLVLVVVITLTVPRLRRRHAAEPQRSETALDGETADAAALRARARAAADAGDLEAALADFFRALARGAEERSLLPDARGRTATEIAAALTGWFPAEASALHTAAACFDRVRYGDARATHDEVRGMDELERRVAASRPVHDTGPDGVESRFAGSMP